VLDYFVSLKLRIVAGKSTMSDKNANIIATDVNSPNFFKITKSANPNMPNPLHNITDDKNNGLNIFFDV
jgi:hypothetical protein